MSDDDDDKANGVNEEDEKEKLGNPDLIYQERLKSLRNLTKELDLTDWMFNTKPF